MVEDFLSGARFSILQEIAKGKNAASDISKQTDISLPYVLSQLILLEAKGIIVKDASKKLKQPGKPKTHYSIKRSHTSVTLLRPDQASQFNIKDNPHLEKYLQLISHIPAKRQTAFSSYYWAHATHFAKVIAIGLIELSDNKIELVAFTQDENLGVLRKSISSGKVSDENKKTITVACWVHSSKEFCQGLKSNDQYYIQLLKKMKPAMDEKEVFAQLKQGCVNK